MFVFAYLKKEKRSMFDVVKVKKFQYIKQKTQKNKNKEKKLHMR